MTLHMIFLCGSQHLLISVTLSGLGASQGDFGRDRLGAESFIRRWRPEKKKKHMFVLLLDTLEKYLKNVLKPQSTLWYWEANFEGLGINKYKAKKHGVSRQVFCTTCCSEVDFDCVLSRCLLY